MAVKINTANIVTVVTAGTRVVAYPTQRWVTSCSVQADNLNSGKIYIGDITVSASNGHFLSPGEMLEIGTEGVRGINEEFDLNEMYFDSDANGNKIRIIYFYRR